MGNINKNIDYIQIDIYNVKLVYIKLFKFYKFIKCKI